MSNSFGYSLDQTHKAHRPSLLARSLGPLVDRIRHFQAVNELDQLSDRQLRDIGIDRPQIDQVARREVSRLRAKLTSFRAL